MEDLAARFLRALKFCLAYDRCRGDPEATRQAMPAFKAPARWALRLSDDPPDNPDQQVALVAGGATKIKAYVFESARLPEIRGASGLLDRINLQDLPALWSQLGCAECVIYANGGEILAFAPTCRASWLADEIERIYARETLVAQSVAVWQPFTLRQLRCGLLAGEEIDANAVNALLGHNPAANATFGSLVASLALAKFRRREANPDLHDPNRPLRALAHIETVPFARRCSSCERRAAVVNARVRDENRPLCEACARKRTFGQLAKEGKTEAIQWWRDAGFRWWPERVRSWAGDLGDHAGIADVHVPEDLDEIGAAALPEGFVGVVYADGNNMGALLETRETPAGYRSFAEAVYDATKNSVFDALDRYCLSDRTPFEILSIGGDDLFLIVPAHVAMPIACAIAQGVERELLRSGSDGFRHQGSYTWPEVQRCQGESPSEQCTVSLSAGVVIADAHTPVFYLEDLAGQLLKSAKQRAKWLKRTHGYFGGTVDFLALKSVSMISGTVQQFREAVLTRDHGRLYARPYTLAEMECLLRTVKTLKASDFPRSQLYRLRESLRAGWARSTVDYLYFLSRDGELLAARKAIEQMWGLDGRVLPHPWRQQIECPERRETIWADVVELYDFVPEEDAGHAQGAD